MLDNPNCISVLIHLNNPWISRSAWPTACRSTSRSSIKSSIWPRQAQSLLARSSRPIRTLALQLKVTPNTIVRAYDELEAAGVIHKRRGSGSFVSEVQQSRLADAERQRIIEQRIDALLAEARQLNFTASDVLRVIRERRAVMERMSSAMTEK